MSERTNLSAQPTHQEREQEHERDREEIAPTQDEWRVESWPRPYPGLQVGVPIGVKEQGSEMRADIHVGDARTVLETLPSESVHCCVTSPPYFALRDYGVAGQLGLEPTLGAYIETMVGVFREVRRVLRSDGTLWLNMGDSYFRNPDKGGSGPNGKESAYLGDVYGRAQGANRANGDDARAVARAGDTGRLDRVASGGEVPVLERGRDASALKPKDLMMVPARLALALQADGWWVRSEIVWAKKAPMPESVTDRPTSSHEKIFLLAKNERYYYDAEAVREKTVQSRPSGNGYKRPEQISKGGFGSSEPWQPTSGRNMRNFWHLGPENFPEAHFATFPTEIPRRAILAGTSERGVCADCGAPLLRQVEPTPEYAKHLGKDWADYEADAAEGRGHFVTEGGVSSQRCVKRNAPSITAAYVTKGWSSSCLCEAPIIPATVFDPFSGAGTTGVVAGKLGRDYIGIELNRDYAEMSERRILREVGPLLVTVQIHEERAGVAGQNPSPLA